MADIAATARALGLSERDIRAQQEALQKGFQAQPRHAASREADSKADIAATARDLGLSERDLLEQQSAYSGHTAAFESRPSSGRAPTPHPPPSTSFPAFVAFLSRWVLSCPSLVLPTRMLALAIGLWTRMLALARGLGMASSADRASARP